MAKLSKDSGILTVGVVTYPFTFEGRRRGHQVSPADVHSCVGLSTASVGSYIAAGLSEIGRRVLLCILAELKASIRI